MKRILYFLGSVYLAVGLLAASALIVIAGTFAESFTDSHLYAASLAYSNPIFLLLFSLFFVNILVSALRRWPFQRKHIPFLVTHLGLLMIISGVMAKNLFGVQGHMALKEGAASDTLVIPETFMLHRQKADGTVEQTPLSESGVVNFYPHGEESYETWIKGKFAFLDGIQPFPAYNYEGEVEVSTRLKIPGDHADHWDVYAYYADDPIEVAKKVYLKDLGLRLTDRKTKNVVYEGPLDGTFSLDKITLASGMTIPLSGAQALLNQPYSPLAADLITTPKLLFVKGEDTHFFAIDAFGHLFHDVFYSKKLERYLAYDKGFSGYAVQAKVPFPFNREAREKKIADRLDCRIPEKERKGCEWGAYLRGIELKDWPLASLMNYITDPAEYRRALLQQIFLVAEELPKCPQEASNEEMFEVYLQAHGLTIADLWQDQGVAFEEQMVFECPLTQRLEPLPPQKKLEENRPLIVVKIDNLYQTLLYDPHATGLCWPKGGMLLSFRPEIKKIPYKVRLRDARQINYLHQTQAYSYESDLLITDLKNQTAIEKTVSMNEVHETWDGYRFYLSSIYPPEETSVQQIRLVVNRDPVKYWLTYPGGLVVALGILLLFNLRNFRGTH